MNQNNVPQKGVEMHKYTVPVVDSVNNDTQSTAGQDIKQVEQEANAIDQNNGIEIINRRILAGKNDSDQSITVIEIDTENRGYSQGYFSITCDRYDTEFLTNDEGERRAREDLEEGEVWRMQVEAGNTTQGLDDFVEDVLNGDGWEHVLGDMHWIGEKDGEEYFAQMTGGGAADGKSYLEINHPVIERKDLEAIAKAANDLHLKHFDGKGSNRGSFRNMNRRELAFAKRVIEIFKKYKEFEIEDLMQYVKTEEAEA